MSVSSVNDPPRRLNLTTITGKLQTCPAAASDDLSRQTERLGREVDGFLAEVRAV